MSRGDDAIALLEEMRETIDQCHCLLDRATAALKKEMAHDGVEQETTTVGGGYTVVDLAISNGWVRRAKIIIGESE